MALRASFTLIAYTKNAISFDNFIEQIIAKVELNGHGQFELNPQHTGKKSIKVKKGLEKQILTRRGK